MALNYFTPKERRSLSDMASLIHQRRVALFLGAGVDQALCEEMPGWYDLVRILSKYDQVELPDSFVAENLLALPTVARHRLGDKAFTEKINNHYGDPKKKAPPVVNSFCDALQNLAPHIPLVVTTNYSPAAYSALGEDRPRPIVELKTLKSVHVPDPGSQRKLFIHLHGRTETPVLDANGYRSAEYGEVLYYEFLRDLMSKWTVLFCGVSFSDPPLRAAASQVKHRYPEISHRHFLVERKENVEPWQLILECCIECTEIRGESTPASLCNKISRCSVGCQRLLRKQYVDRSGLHARLSTLGRSLSYDVQTIQILEHSDLPKTWKMLEPIQGNGKIFMPSEDPTVAATFICKVIRQCAFIALADFFEYSGDYESMSQRIFSHVITARQLKSLVNKLKAKIDSISTEKELVTLLRVERHLRHLLYVAGGNMTKKRNEIWLSILGAWESKGNLLNFDKFDDVRLLSDFYYGYYEVNCAKKKGSNILKKLHDKLFSLENYKARILIAKDAWEKPSENNEEKFESLRSKAFDAGWESMEAKFCVDIVRSRIKRMKANWSTTNCQATEIDELQALCDHAKRSAKVAGTTRRYISALLYSALWMPETTQALSAVRAAAELCMENGVAVVEPSLWDGVRWVWWVVNGKQESELKMIDHNANPQELAKQQEDFWKDYVSPFYS